MRPENWIFSGTFKVGKCWGPASAEKRVSNWGYLEGEMSTETQGSDAS